MQKRMTKEIEYYRQSVRNGIKLDRKRKVQSLLYDLKLDKNEQEVVQLMIDTDVEPDKFWNIVDNIEKTMEYEHSDEDDSVEDWLNNWIKMNTDIVCYDFAHRYLNSGARYAEDSDRTKLSYACVLKILDEQPLTYDWYDDVDDYPSLIS